ncbi:Uncharacterised protein [Mycobacteroides abscessus subsp. abscessus]|nr:Uncharacterised protein [Mycobacteroides abscessus subsp. abscessus]
MRKIGLECPKAAIAESMEEALEIQSRFGFPVILVAVSHTTKKNSLKFVNAVSIFLQPNSY